MYKDLNIIYIEDWNTRIILIGRFVSNKCKWKLENSRIQWGEKPEILKYEKPNIKTLRINDSKIRNSRSLKIVLLSSRDNTEICFSCLLTISRFRCTEIRV